MSAGSMTCRRTDVGLAWFTVFALPVNQFSLVFLIRTCVRVRSFTGEVRVDMNASVASQPNDSVPAGRNSDGPRGRKRPIAMACS